MRTKLAFTCLLLSPLLASAQQPTPAPAFAVDAPARARLATDPWNYGVFFGGGVGVGDRSDFSFTNAGIRLGKVMSDPHLPSVLRGQFEYSGEVMPYWQSFTPPAGLQFIKVYYGSGGTGYAPEPLEGGTYTGVSITPIILRWDLTPHKHFAPFLQGAGGLVWTNHKYPPDVSVPEGTPGRTSVFNFTPQFGIGARWFFSPRHSLDFNANAVHISSASLGDRNPGVNASVQFQIGYSWWR